MDDLKLNANEINQITTLAGVIDLPEKQPDCIESGGCKGCEGGCAAELCAF